MSEPPQQTSSIALVFKPCRGLQSRSCCKDSTLQELNQISHTGQDDTMLPLRGLLLPRQKRAVANQGPAAANQPPAVALRARLLGTQF